MLTLSSLSTEYVRVAVSATTSGAAVDPTADTVQMAFTAEGVAPVAGDWKTSSWEVDATTNPDTYYARCLVGPSGTVALSAALFDVWVKISDSPEVPIRKAGSIRVI